VQYKPLGGMNLYGVQFDVGNQNKLRSTRYSNNTWAAYIHM